LPALRAYRRYPCELCHETADGELEGFGLLCVDCCDRVLERMYALLSVPPVDRYALAFRLERAAPLRELEPTRPEPVNWRRYLPRTRAERHRQWREAGLLDP
jgi:hypothetical protein